MNRLCVCPGFKGKCANIKTWTVLSRKGVCSGRGSCRPHLLILSRSLEWVGWDRGVIWSGNENRGWVHYYKGSLY